MTREEQIKTEAITESLNLFPKYNIGKGFYELSVIDINGVQTVEFNELSANDM